MPNRILTRDEADALFTGEAQRLREVWSDGERSGARMVPPLVDCSDGPPLPPVTQAQALTSLHAAILNMVDVLELAIPSLPEDPVLRRLHHASSTTLLTFATTLLPYLEEPSDG
jgi:hypothetical protein